VGSYTHSPAGEARALDGAPPVPHCRSRGPDSFKPLLMQTLKRGPMEPTNSFTPRFLRPGARHANPASAVGLFLRCLGLLACLADCGGDRSTSPPNPVRVVSLSLYPSADTIYIGDAIQVTAAMGDSSGSEITSRQIAWSVPDTTTIKVLPSVYTAQVDGRRTGTAVVVGSIDGLTDTSVITVWTRVASVTIAPRPATLVIGDTVQFTAILTDTAGHTLSDRPISWEATDSYDMIPTLAPAQYWIGGSGTTYVKAEAEGKRDSVFIRLTADAAFRTVATGEDFGCGVSAPGTLYCWGWNGWGQLGLGTVIDARLWNMHRSVIGAPAGRLAASLHSACALDTQGAARCWGFDDNGQLGNAAGTQPCFLGPCRGTPLAVIGAPAFDSLSLGLTHGCGLTANGTSWCWGSNSWGELGTGSPDASRHGAEQVVSATPFVSITAGGSHTCALDAAGLAWCWGSNTRGELGRGTADSLAYGTPDTVVGSLRFQAISTGPSYTCGLTTGGLAYCWGTNEHAQLGLGSGDSLPHPAPAQVVGGTQFTALVAGYEHTCALTSNGTALCWGKNEFGELGTPPGAPACRYFSAVYPCSGTPLPVAGGIAFVSIRPGRYTTCGLGRDDIAYCWGANSVGQLGDQTFDNRSSPAPVVGQP
jgi:alpha-tubulin suppressor-like RCC1 family protein